MTNDKHRNLCAATSGILEAFYEMSEQKEDLDHETVEQICEQFNRKHDELGAETPTPDMD
jgi:hypothetical protein